MTICFIFCLKSCLMTASMSSLTFRKWNVITLPEKRLEMVPETIYTLPRVLLGKDVQQICFRFEETVGGFIGFLNM